MIWYDILKAVRRVSAKTGGAITGAALIGEARIRPTERSRADQIASGWLSKLSRWGYVRRTGTHRKEGRGRPAVVYVLTRWGERFRPKNS